MNKETAIEWITGEAQAHDVGYRFVKEAAEKSEDDLDRAELEKFAAEIAAAKCKQAYWVIRATKEILREKILVEEKHNFNPCKRLPKGELLEALNIMIGEYGDKGEIWVSPFLHRVRENFPHLSSEKQKEIIADLADHGCLVVLQREGNPHPYSVMILNMDHQQVKEAYGSHAN